MALAEVGLAKDACLQEDRLCQLVEAGTAEGDASGIEAQEVRVYDFAHVSSCVLGDRLRRQHGSERSEAVQRVDRTSHADLCNLKVNRVAQPRIGIEDRGISKNALETLELFRRDLRKRAC